MALFKISKGLKANLPSAKTAGYCWYTTDDSLFYIDYEDENGVVQRKALNAKDAETITGASLATVLNSTDLEIPTSKAVLAALAGKSDTTHNHDSVYATKGAAAAAQAKADEAYDLADLAANIIYVGPDEPTDPNIKVWINTAEEGTGVIPVLPRVATINLLSSAWSGSVAPYSQVVSIATVTSATKIELNPTVAQIVSLQNDDIALMAENSDGVVTVYSFGGKPSANMTMQATLTEVAYV